MRKYKWFIDFEKEEKWLNEMAAKGWALKGKQNAYLFESGAEAETNIKIDYRQFTKSADFEEYKGIFADSGWQHIAGSKSSGNQYFKQVDTEADADIFSDDISRAGRYKRISHMCLSFMVAYLPLIFLFSWQEFFNFEAFSNPRSLFFTPGLWERSGLDFWSSFLFEAPFVLFRGYLPLLIALSLIPFLVTSLKSWLLYRKATNENR